MRALILWFAFFATLLIPILLLVLLPPWWPIAIGVMALSHALVLWPTLRPNSQWLGPVITAFESTSNEVWLTIDDGPTDDTTALLDALDARNVKATFFVKGSLCAKHPELVRLMLARGHNVVNHSQTHPSGAFWCLSPAAIARQIDECNAALRTITGETPRLFRAPVGMKNPFVHPILAQRTMTIIGWSVRGFDSFGDDVERVVNRIVPRVDSGSIIVMHQGRGFSVACVSRVVDELHALGYSFVIPAFKRLKTKR
ncbi:MAG TPA: polysaccharide deacetylase family protein [Thermoanaerobaculia bacterium]|jgi:peptidoglycan/xylan/chitin deacetylase (PgdA/CDA1 family)|nr:polysaccharide deacetylase family protein [Thermoanaerobaculia bacterium]